MKTIKTLALAIIFSAIATHAGAQQLAAKAGYGVPVMQTEPEFPGGDKALAVFLHDNLKYPQELKDSKTGGRVVIMFIIDKEGKLIDPIIMKGVNSPINEEALRVVKMMPAWKPATAGGMPVNKQYILPVDFVPASI